MLPKTSVSHPLFIDSVLPGDSTGLIGMTLCPGKTDPHAMEGPWERDLNLDLDAVLGWGATTVISLITNGEFQGLKIPVLTFAEGVGSRGLNWFHLPIVDGQAPDDEFKNKWIQAGRQIRAILNGGNNVVIHCRGGLGRAGTLAAQVLIEYGSTPDEAILRVRRSRKGAIETPVQVNYLQSLGPPVGEDEGPGMGVGKQS